MVDLTDRRIGLIADADGAPVEIGEVTAYRCANLAEAIAAAATDDYALGLLLAATIRPGWLPVVTVNINGAAGNVAEALAAIASDASARLWTLDLNNGLNVSFYARPAQLEALAVDGSETTFRLTLSPASVATLTMDSTEPGEGFSFDFSFAPNLLGGIFTGVL